MLRLPPPMEPAPLRSRRSMQAPTDAVISWSPKRRPACRWPWSRLCHRHVHQLVASADRIRSTVRLVREARISNTLFLNARASVNQKRPLRQSSVPTCRIGADIDAVPGDAIRLAGVWFFHKTSLSAVGAERSDASDATAAGRLCEKAGRDDQDESSRLRRPARSVAGETTGPRKC